MVGRYVIELEPEVRDWLDTLRLPEYAKVERAIAAQQACAAGHESHDPATELYERKWN